ncbi:MAG: twin-arginine translocation pathway signal [Altererythrobacter sp.]|uniref:murein L,D-transpeptidase catalytic domain-containing protein n=1 Tax=Paracoccus sp. UBA889 TaxID=1947056 RepID=UPI000C65AE88|nr:murein L,D-transpeptidase catalytic domain family protein [Paracoccus sp. UBA889]MAW91032.1 twin-arginine translocation pathway signal [Altererythrobacter sp.]MBK62364.1 twin-arginine translocation pathway signal [Altererythrobacter sp.]|tara:strand:+ start:675 stop:1382 length:708 start_codon:yes stop_codon:yes gene_type:complete
MNRRDLLKSSLAAGAALTLPVRVSAQVNPTASRDAQLFAIAREQLARVGDVLWKKDIVGIADFGLHSSKRRFHFVDLENERVQSFHVSHGTGSDSEHDGWLKRYSNIEGSEATSRGAYMTRSWYTGRYGTSIRLDGLDPTNDHALPRAIVMHQAEYARPEHVDRWGRLGRSNGCFALGPDQFDFVLLKLSGGRLLYAESLGLTENGSRVPPPVTQTELLRSDNGGTFERTNPGVF